MGSLELSRLVSPYDLSCFMAVVQDRVASRTLALSLIDLSKTPLTW